MRNIPATFSDLKRLVNGMDESRWGATPVEISINGSVAAVMVDLSTTSGLPANPEGSAAAKWYGVSPGEKPKFIIQGMTY